MYPLPPPPNQTRNEFVLLLCFDPGVYEAFRWPFTFQIPAFDSQKYLLQIFVFSLRGKSSSMVSTLFSSPTDFVSIFLLCPFRVRGGNMYHAYTRTATRSPGDRESASMSTDCWRPAATPTSCVHLFNAYFCSLALLGFVCVFVCFMIL
jgi:hypothetical protein